MKVLALDIAGSSTGWSFGEDHQLKEWGKYISNLRHSRGRRLHDFAQWMGELFETHKPDVILIEKPFLGRNSNVLANLSKFVAMAEYQAYNVLGLAIEDDWFLDPRQIKRLMKVKKSTEKGNTKSKHDDNKKLMVQKINELYGMRLKYCKQKSKKYNDDDIADSIALLHAWWIVQGKKNGE
jgi:Holliday junction resolvasome RuvABC endonuclease subunit